MSPRVIVNKFPSPDRRGVSLTEIDHRFPEIIKETIAKGMGQRPKSHMEEYVRRAREVEDIEARMLQDYSI